MLPPLYGDETRKEQLMKEFRVSKNIVQETKSYDPSLVGRIKLTSASAGGGAAQAGGGAAQAGGGAAQAGAAGGGMQPPSKRVKEEL